MWSPLQFGFKQTWHLQHFLGGGIAHLPLFHDTQISFLTMCLVTFCFCGPFLDTRPEAIVSPDFDFVAMKEAWFLLKPLFPKVDFWGVGGSTFECCGPDLCHHSINHAPGFWSMLRPVPLWMDIEVHSHFMVKINQFWN